MKDSTIVRLRMSKQLFESLADQILAEAKDMSGGVYTEVVKQKKEKKKVEDKKEKVEEMETRVAEKEVKEEVRKGVHDNFEKWKASFPDDTEFKSQDNYMMAVDKAGKELGKWNPIDKKGMHADDFQYKNLEEKEHNLKEYVGLGPDEVKALEYLAAIMGTGTGAAIASQYGKELKDIAGKVKDFIKSKKNQKADSSVAEVKKKVKLRESEKSEHVIGFQEYDDVLDSFLNWLKWHYKEASTDNVDEWEEDESFYFDKPSLTLTLWNDEFDKKINSEFAEYIEELEDNIEWEEWGDS